MPDEVGLKSKHCWSRLRIAAEKQIASDGSSSQGINLILGMADTSFVPTDGGLEVFAVNAGLPFRNLRLNQQESVMTLVACRAVVVAAFLILVVTVSALSSSNVERRLKTSLADAPSVKLHLTLKRQSMAVHGQTHFDVFANPVVSDDGKKVLYDGYATFIEDGQELTYMFVNGSFYVVDTDADNDGVKDREPTVRCLPSALPFDAIVPALNDVTPIPSASIGGEAVSCSSGDLYKTTFSGSKFALCVSGASGFTAHSSDMTIEVTYLSTPISVSEPELSDDGASCAKSAEPVAVTATAVALMTGDEVPESTSRKLEAAEHMAMEASTCKCKSEPRPCVFFHGIGNRKESPVLLDKPCARMGSIGDHAPCCTVVKYAHLNTMDFAWTNGTLQDKFCKFSLSMSDSSDLDSKVIEDTIIVTHSMAGITLAAALAAGKCSFGSGVEWVSLSAPMKGSMLADYSQGFCDGSTAGEFAADLLDLMGQCPLVASRDALVYEGGDFASAELNAAYVVAQQAYAGNVTAAVCSNSYRGVNSIYKSIFILAGKTVPHKSRKNDGLVEYEVCTKGLDESLFGNSYTDRFYRPKLNHADTAFMTSDGFFSDARKPFKWFECLL